MSDFSLPRGLYVAHQAPLPMSFPEKNTGVNCHFLLQGIFPTQGSTLGLLELLYCRLILYPPFSSAQFSSVAQSCPTLCDPMDCSTQASLSITNSQSLLKLMSIKSVMPSNHLIFCCPLLLPPSTASGSFQMSVLRIRRPRYWGFTISPSTVHARLISFRMDWLDLLAVQGTLKSLLQHHSSKASILWCSAFFIVQLSHPYYWENHSFD